MRLSRAGGKRPLRDDKKRKLVLLDPDDEAVRRALVEYRARPERTLRAGGRGVRGGESRARPLHRRARSGDVRGSGTANDTYLAIQYEDD